MSKRFDLVIKNGTVVLEDKCIKGSIGIKDGRIACIADAGTELEADKVIEAEGKYVMPGAVDSHSHIWEPTAYDYREDFYTGSCTAASGGITTMIEMPLSVPPVQDKESFANRVKYAEKSIIDYALWGALIPAALGHIKELSDLGCPAFKGFISKASPEYPSADDFTLLMAMKEIKETGGIAGVHAENSVITDGFEKQFRDKGLYDGRYHEMGRPEIAEMEAIQKALLLAEETGCRLHICHLSTARAMRMIEDAKRRGVKVTVETCPHYLTLTVEDLDRL